MKLISKSLFAGAIVAIAATMVQADITVKLVSAPYASNAAPRYGGGAYVVAVTGDPIGGSKANFLTFCLERNEGIELNVNYNADLGSKAIIGSGGPHPDPISAATAYLYSHYLDGDLDTLVAGFDYSDADDVRALQIALWNLEDEPLHPRYATLQPTVDALVNQATAAVGTGDYAGSRVRVLNLWLTTQVGGGIYNAALNRYEYQSILVLVPAPAAPLLVGIGLALVGWAKRRIA